MFFVFFIVNLIFSVHFSLQAKLDDGRLNLKTDTKDSKSEANEIEKHENVIKKSDLEELLQLKNQYMVKNYIDEFETHLALHFIPDWTSVNRFDSLARQSIDIRRQKWNFIFEKLNHSLIVQSLNSELEKAGIDRSTFCGDIAEIYFTLSDNNLVFDQERNTNSDKKQKTFPFVRSPSQEKSILVFMNCISNFKMNRDKNDDTVQIPKSLYIDLMRKDAHAAIIKQHHEDKVERLKNAFKNKIRHGREHNYHPDSDVSSY